MAWPTFDPKDALRGAEQMRLDLLIRYAVGIGPGMGFEEPMPGVRVWWTPVPPAGDGEPPTARFVACRVVDGKPWRTRSVVEEMYRGVVAAGGRIVEIEPGRVYRPGASVLAPSKRESEAAMRAIRRAGCRLSGFGVRGTGGQGFHLPPTGEGWPEPGRAAP